MLIERFTDLSRRLPGHRIEPGYEHTNFVGVEERNGITEQAPHVVRILSQLEFALALNAELGGRFDAELDAALALLERGFERAGVVDRELAGQAEALLLPLSREAKTYTVTCVAHAHIDMNWMWSWHETVASTLDTFRTMLDLMDDYPDFVFSQSQAAVYRIVEVYDKPLMRRIQQRIREGRWEVTASTWVENDKNMPTAEALVRHNLYARAYLRDTWGVDPESLCIDFSPDTFGHGRNMPEILSQAGVRFYYHCRAYDGPHTLYRWQAQSGQQILVYREPFWYNAGVYPRMGTDAVRIAKRYGMRQTMALYGVGDHGGGPTRRDIERIRDMDGWPVFPNMKFGTLRGFFERVEALRDELPVVDAELNFFAPGCLTTQSRLKKGNRMAETLLFDAEALSACASLRLGTPYEAGDFETAWRNVLFGHFHDILTGSCVRDTREHAMGLYQESFAYANTQRTNAMRAIAAAINAGDLATDPDIANTKAEGAGAAFGVERFQTVAANVGAGDVRLFVAFNPSPQDRRQTTELTVWDWKAQLDEFEVVDDAGNAVAFQLVDREQQTYWDHRYFRVLIDARLPALGYGCYVLRRKGRAALVDHTHPDQRNSYPMDADIVLENEYIRARFASCGTAIVELTDKRTGETLIAPDRPACFRLVEEVGKSASAWTIGRHASHAELTQGAHITQVSTDGPLRQSFRFEQTLVGKTRMEGMVFLDHDKAAIGYDMRIDWHEIADESSVPMLDYVAPLRHSPAAYRYDVPGGVIDRPAMAMDVPANRWVAAPIDGRALFLTTDGKYGFRGDRDAISVTLIHASRNPDPYPERGIHDIRLYVGVEDAAPKALADASFALEHPVLALSARPGRGELPMRASLFELDAAHSALCGMKQAEDGHGTIVRLVELEGREERVRLRFPMPVQKAEWVDSHERGAGRECACEGCDVLVELPAHGLRAVRVVVGEG